MVMDRLRSFSDGKTLVNLFSEINHATLDAIAQVSHSKITNNFSLIVK